MKFTDNDRINIENLMKISRQGSFTLSGEEILAFSEAIKWLAGLHHLVKVRIEEDKKPPVIIEEIKPVISKKKK